MKSISLISIRLICLLEDIERREHKLRKYLSLKLDYIYLKLYLTKCFNDLQILYKRYVYLNTTRPKPVEHGYVFSMAVGTIGEWLRLVPFLLGDEQLILRGGDGLAVFKNKYLGRQTP